MAACLQCLARLDDLSFQPSITCKMRKKSSGSFTSLYGGFVGILWTLFVNLLRSEYICGSYNICGGFCVFVEVLCVIVEVFM